MYTAVGRSLQGVVLGKASSTASKNLRFGTRPMLDLFQAGGILMLPIAFCSVIVVAICLERWWSLRRAQVLPEPLLARMEEVNGWPSNPSSLAELGSTSELGYLLAVGLANRAAPRDELEQAIQGALDVTAHNLERHLTGLGSWLQSAHC